MAEMKARCKVRLLEVVAGVGMPGDEVEVDYGRAHSLVRTGYAEELGPPVTTRKKAVSKKASSRSTR